MQRVYSLLTIKTVDDDQRIIEGLASGPETDRVGDIVEPMGAEFTLPLPFCWQHESQDAAIGEVFEAKATPKGIRFKARIEKDDVPGLLKDRLDYAWRSIKKKLVRGISIGFRPIESEPIKGTYGERFLKSEILEMSAVTIPAYAPASIQTIKSADLYRAASGAPKVSPGVSGIPITRHPKPGGPVPTITESIKDYEATRAVKKARKAELMADSSKSGTTLDEAQEDEYETLDREVEAIDKHLTRLRKEERDNVAAAIPVPEVRTIAGATAARSGVQVVRGAHLSPGTAFARYAMALAAGRGSVSDAMRYAERWKDTTPEVLKFIETKAEPGTTTDDVYGWAGPLVFPTNLVSEFVELLRPATILGKLTGLRNTPFNIRVPVQTGGSTVNWVGEAAPKPVSELSFDALALGRHKIAGIVVLTDELVKDSSPAAEDTVRRDMVEQIVRFLDAALVNPSASGSANNPASLTYNVTPTSASGTDAEALYADLNEAFATFDDTDLGTNSLYILMRPKLARGIAALRNALGQFEFTGLTPAGGTLMGFPVIVSNSVPASSIVLVKADEVLIADDNSVALDASREATLDMSGGESPAFSLWQRNCVGIRAERGVTWVKRRPDAVSVIDSASYGPVSGS